MPVLKVFKVLELKVSVLTSSYLKGSGLQNSDFKASRLKGIDLRVPILKSSGLRSSNLKSTSKVMFLNVLAIESSGFNKFANPRNHLWSLT